MNDSQLLRIAHRLMQAAGAAYRDHKTIAAVTLLIGADFRGHALQGLDQLPTEHQAEVIRGFVAGQTATGEVIGVITLAEVWAHPMDAALNTPDVQDTTQRKEAMVCVLETHTAQRCWISFSTENGHFRECNGATGSIVVGDFPQNLLYRPH